MSSAPYRRKTHTVNVGNVKIGSEHDIVPQSMTTTPTLDTEASAAQVEALADAGARRSEHGQGPASPTVQSALCSSPFP